MRVAALYDIHGNLPALEAVLQDIRHANIDQIVVGGDVVPGPMPRESGGISRLWKTRRRGEVGCAISDDAGSPSDLAAGVQRMSTVPSMRDNATNPNGDMRQSAVLQLVSDSTPNAENGTFRPKRVTNAERRPREHVTG